MNKNASNQKFNNFSEKEFDSIAIEAFNEVFGIEHKNSSKEKFIAEVKDYLDDIEAKSNIEGIEEGMCLLDRFYDFRSNFNDTMEGLMHMLMDLLQILIVKVRGHKNVTGRYKITYC